MPTSDQPADKSQQLKILIPEVRLQQRVQEIAHEINHDFQGKEIVCICILKGSFIFFSDLIRHIDLPMSCEFLGVSSYGNKMVSSGEVKITLDINEPLEGKHVIVVEDIIDSGLTLSYIMNSLRARKPATLKSCALLFKPDSLKIDIEADYLGFKIGNEFVVGYGTDYAGKYRGLPYVGYLEHGH
ncbi:MAG: hypoxanthine phosphoribosyltransferase [Oligoflexia bacterium]|nr:hypoxanthine phosphoribosyltransferase [Oligoflexia bacterium]